MAQNTGLVVQSEDKLSVMVRNLHPTKLQLKPLTQSTVKPETAGKEGKAGKAGKESAAATKRKRGQKASKDADASKKSAQWPAPAPAAEIKLPDKYRLLPVPKSDGAHAQDAHTVALSRAAKAAQISLREDLRTAVGYKGYRMVRATHGVHAGAWYFEVKVCAPQGGEDGHCRLGWCTESADVNTPVGYDTNSYAYRDIGGTKFHESIGAEYGEAYGPGDVVGCLLVMGDPPATVRMRQRINLKGVEYLVEEERDRVSSHGSSITFYKNGVSQGAAFTDVWAEVYYPAASLFKAATVTFNFGPDFECKPAGLDARPVSELATPPPAAADAAGGAGPSGSGGDAAMDDSRPESRADLDGDGSQGGSQDEASQDGEGE